MTSASTSGSFGFRNSRPWTNLFFLYVSLGTLAAGLAATRSSRNWLISDWLINYEGGFVRRGLPGQVAFYLWHATGVSPVAWAACFYLICFAIFFFAAWKLLDRSSRNFWVLALVFSPAMLSFQVEHPQAAFRKEVIFFSALGVFLLLLQKRGLSSVEATTYLTFFLIVAVLSHEALLFYSPYLFIALMLGGRSLRQAAVEFALPLFAALAVAYACSRHLGDVEVARQICHSLGYRLGNPNSGEICSNGAIPYLRYSAETARGMSQEMMRSKHYLNVFPWFALLALLPAIGEGAFLSRAGLRRDVRVLWAGAVVAFLLTLVLFWFAIDWGRWIYIHIVCISLLLLFLDARYADVRSSEHRIASGDAPMLAADRKYRLPAVLLLTAYATMWALPNNVDNMSRMGYFGRVLDKVRHVKMEPALPHVDPVPLPPD